MSIHQIKQQVIRDNPNLSHRELARFLGISRFSVQRFRKTNSLTPLWKHKGRGIPFTHDSMNPDGIYKLLKYKDRQLARGKLETVMVELDRLIFCLENNNGKLPPQSVEGWSLDNLEFNKRK